MKLKTAKIIQQQYRKKVIDVLFIVITPNHLDGTYEMMAIEAGIPFLCEKPVGLKGKKMREIAEQIEKHELVTTSGFLLRYGTQT